MVLYNVTMKIDCDIEEEWLSWMKQKHIPDVMNSGNFLSAQISRLLDQPGEEDPTYVIQYRCAGREQYENYIANFAPGFRDDYDRRYKGKFVAFRTLMEVLQEMP